MDAPTYTHDCDKCIFLGSFQGEDGDHDLYVHRDDEHPALTTVIARWGNDGPENNSGLGSPLPSLVEARRRAVERGILPQAWFVGVTFRS